MKFDGYFLLSDSLGVENLQSQSIANFKWELRRLFTGISEPMPYPVAVKSLKLQRVYAISTCIYRIFLYLGIAYMIYTFWFKALGLILMTGVLLTMIIRPVFKEVVEYMKILKRHGMNGRALVSSFLVILLIVLFFVPLPRKVTAPALLTAQEASRIYAPSTGDVSEIHVVKGQLVKKGDSLITLSNSFLDYEKLNLQEEIKLLERRLATESEWTGSSTLQSIQKENIDSKKAELEQVNGRIADLELKSPVNGEIVLIEDWVRVGSPVAENMVLAEIATTERPEIRAYLTAYDKQHVEIGNAVFFNKSDSRSLDAEVASISSHAITNLDDEVLAIPNGGAIAVASSQSDVFKPKKDLYLAVLDPADTDSKIRHEQSGVVMFPAKARSLATSTIQKIYGVILRESGF